MFASFSIISLANKIKKVYIFPKKKKENWFQPSFSCPFLDVTPLLDDEVSMAWETLVASGSSPRKISISSKYFGGFPLSAQVHLCTFYIQLLDVSPWFCTEDNLADNPELTFLCSSYCRYRHFCGYYSASPLFLLCSRLISRPLPLYQSTFLLSLTCYQARMLYTYSSKWRSSTNARSQSCDLGARFDIDLDWIDLRPPLWVD